MNSTSLLVLSCVMAAIAGWTLTGELQSARAKDRPLGSELQPIRTLEGGHVRIYAVPFGDSERCVAVADSAMNSHVVSGC